MLPFKKGAFAAAIEGQIPILPIVISHYDFLDTKKMIMDLPAKVDIHVLPLIQTEGYEGDQGVMDLTNKTAAVMQSVFSST